MVLAQQTYRFTAEEYHRMGEVGILPPDVRVELVDGEIKAEYHLFIHLTRASLNRLNCGLGSTSCKVERSSRYKNPIRLDDYNEPQPDVTVLLIPE